MSNSTPSVLFVCLGNICRSPTAHAVFRHLAKQEGVPVRVESAGTIGYHQGNPPDPRAQEAGEARGYDFSGLSAQQVQDSDFQEFDFIFAMDKSNLKDLQARCPTQYMHKISLFLSLLGPQDETEVPDPYYGGSSGFEHVLDLVEKASKRLLSQLVQREQKDN